MSWETFIPAAKGKFGRGLFDSRLDQSKVSAIKHVELVLELKIKLVLVAAGDTHPTDKLVRRHGKTYARDWNGNLFELAPWVGNEKDEMRDKFRDHGELFWSWNFWFKHRRSDYSSLDKTLPDMGAIRPGVVGMLKINFVDKDQHRKIYLFKLDTSAANYIDHKTGRATPITRRDSFTFRSDSAHYDSLDLDGATAHIFNKLTRTFEDFHHDTVAHELGHAIGQEHIMDLKYNKNKAKTRPTAEAYYGKSIEDAKNVMGDGDQITVENAISWRERLAQHTGTHTSDWVISLSYFAPRQLNVLETIGL